MARYQAAIDAGGDIQEISRWINNTKTERLAAEATLRGTSHAPDLDKQAGCRAV
jgi:hypothetical protein